MHEHHGVAVQRRLDELAPFLRNLGHQTRETYERAGILAVMPDTSFPIADARFSRKDYGMGSPINHGARSISASPAMAN
ncbi:hypothetical protein ACFVTE_18540 [Arthrobacter sp. NPDC058097]|uniref:hypothetical protein n=1 Tax=Arthrobacter sp. NPDC058097 TaxID=3346340 RepID=UPI0036D85729